MILGVMLARKAGNGGIGLESLRRVCDDVYVAWDDSPVDWMRPEPPLRQRYVDHAVSAGADWAVCLDDDEKFSNPSEMRDFLMAASADIVAFPTIRFDVLEDNRAQVEPHWRCWRPRAGQRIAYHRFLNVPACPNDIYQQGVSFQMPAEKCCIIHYGFTNPQIRRRKYALYREFGKDYAWLKDGHGNGEIPEWLRGQI